MAGAADTVAVLARLARRAGEHAELVMAGRSHNVAAQATTLGKRFASAADELMLGLNRIQDLLDRSGGFGTFLMLGHDWASPAATYHSYELFAREVIPHFKGQLTAPHASHEWAKGMRNQLLGRAGQAIVNAITEATDDSAAKATS